MADHFAEAERLLGADREDWTNTDRLARAQVHATLALAAAVSAAALPATTVGAGRSQISRSATGRDRNTLRPPTWPRGSQ